MAARDEHDAARGTHAKRKILSSRSLVLASDFEGAFPMIVQTPGYFEAAARA